MKRSEREGSVAAAKEESLPLDAMRLRRSSLGFEASLLLTCASPFFEVSLTYIDLLGTSTPDTRLDNRQFLSLLLAITNRQSPGQ